MFNAGTTVPNKTKITHNVSIPGSKPNMGVDNNTQNVAHNHNVKPTPLPV